MESLYLWVYMLLLLVQYTTGFSLLKNNSTMNHLCHEHESNLLLLFKQQLSPSEEGFYYKTQYWNESSDCCLWDGVTCNHFTGHVIALDLSYNFMMDHLTGKLQSNSSLFHLTHLRSLNLAFNDFNGSAIPPEFGRLNALTYLNLSMANFAGELPMEFYHLSNLLSLDLAKKYDYVSLEAYDYLSNNKIRCDVNMLFANMTRLRTLVLSDQHLYSELPMNVSTFLTHLDLEDTGLYGDFPANIFEIPNLQFLYLGFNPGLKGSFTKSLNWSNVHSIQELDLSGTSLSGRLPESIGFMSNLNYLRLSGCRFSGRIPSSLTNMSRLEHLDISSNALTGPFPSSAGQGLQKLEMVYLDNNSIQGMIPPWLFTLPSLNSLYLSSNRLVGRIGKLNSQTLNRLDLSFNGLNIELQSFYNLSGIGTLSVSHNTVIEHDGGVENVTFPNLWELAMSYCEIKKFPNFLRSNMPNLFYLDFSYNSLTYVGDLPWQNLQYLNLHSNSLRGTFPSSICNMSELIILNLSHNKLSGHIPECLANASTQLVVLDLRRNEFHGKIPTTIGTMSNLANLGLNGNRLEGILPPSLSNCTLLEVIDLGNNMIHDTFPWWLYVLPELKILILKSNSFHGSITSPTFTNNSLSNLHILDVSYNNFTGLLPEKLLSSLDVLKSQTQASPDFELYMGTKWGGQSYEYSVTLSVKGGDEELTKVLKIFTTVDLSSNNLNGNIPESLSNLTSLRLLNLSHNNIHGSIPPALGRMTNLEQLDLSSNQLTGGIPQSLTNLTFLGALDLSCNHLVGPIPQGNQFLTFSKESYVGNSGLCGAPLTKSCGSEPPSPGGLEEEEDDDGFMMGFTWKVVVMGYGCGIVLGFILGSVMMSMEKPKWLVRFVYVEAAIILSKQKKRRRVVQRRR